MNNYTIGYIHHDPEIYGKYLKPCLDKLKDCREFNDLPIKSGEMPSKIYNQIIDKATTDIIIITHEDVTFTPDLLDNIDSTIKELGDDWSTLGLVGRDRYSIQYKNNWCKADKIFECDTLDCCFIVLKKSDGVKFDEINFNGFHLYVEDYCAQARLKTNRGCFTIKMQSSGDVDIIEAPSMIQHHSSTFRRLGANWGDYNKYKKVLNDKWDGLKTT